MKRKILVLSVLVVVLACGEKRSISKQQAPDLSQSIRKPAVAGKFYPGDKDELTKTIDGFLSNAKPEKAKGMITGMIVPHAGYEYSGHVAAYGFKELEGETVDTVIIMGNSHHERFPGAAIFSGTAFETPLGSVPVDTALAKAIVGSTDKATFNDSPHILEHSIEVEVPFLQRVIKDFKVVPVLFGNSGEDDFRPVADAIVKNIKGKNVLVIASSDLTHYPSYKDSKYADARTLKAIATGDVSTLSGTVFSLESENLANTVTFACGIDAIKALLLIERSLGANEIKILKSANSGDVMNDKSRVVGYGAVGFFSERRGDLLNKTEEAKLLDIAKKTVETYVKTGKEPVIKNTLPFLEQKLGAFVTLKEQGELRGCIGRFSPTDIPLYQVVENMAVAAATEDTRFKPVAKEELPFIDYEISVLSTLSKVSDAGDIVLGRDGVKVIKGANSGVFLPQVATETGWDMDKFMGELCSQKAGLPQDCWKDKDTNLYTFTAQVFGGKK